jgi:ABC-type Mn2+/Zn2+ transport system ATPase subunit
VTEAEISGREHLVADVLAQMQAERSVLVTGVAGVGKSTVLKAVAEAIGAQGARVLSARPTEDDARLPFVTLIDLSCATSTSTSCPGTAPRGRARPAPGRR